MKKKLINMLNEALRMEYSDVFMYPREADKLKENDKEVSAKFEKFGRMELRHADNLAMQIQMLGGQAVWNFDVLETRDSISDMLSTHLRLEKTAIEFYGSLIEAADKEEEDQLKLILKGIEAEERGHFAELKGLVESRKIE